MIAQAEDYEDRRRSLDLALGVTSWPGPVGVRPRRDPAIPDSVPDWWRGDEEASQSFLREMGIG